MNKNVSLVQALVCTLIVSVAVDAYACGESLYRVGRGIVYRDYSAPLPANVIVYTRNDSEKAFAERLARSGHHVTVVETPDELTSAMTQGDYEVVIAPFENVRAVDPQIAHTGSILPFVEHGKQEEKMAKELYGRFLTPDDDLRAYLRAIHRSLKNA